MIRKALLAAILAAVGLLAGCATTHDAYYAALKADIESRAAYRVAQAQENAARSTAIAQIAATGGESAKTAAVLALALNQGGGSLALQPPQSAIPAPPPSTGERIWTTFLQVADVGLRAWGIKVGGDVAIRQSDNQAAQAIASYGAFQTMGGQIAQAGTAGYPYVQAPQANQSWTLSGTGVLGSGAYTGPVTTTRTCTGGAGAAGGAGDPAGNGGIGGSASC